MKIVHYSQTPLAGAPYHIVQCLKKYTDYDVHLINWKVNYADKRVFPKDIIYPQETAKAMRLIREADVVHIHNQLNNHLVPLIDKKKQKVIATVHSVPRLFNWKALKEFAHEFYVIRQPYQLKEYEADNIPSLPTPIDIEEIIPQTKPELLKTIVYAPTVRASQINKASKGFPEIKPILDKIDKKKDVSVQIYWNKPHLTDIKIKTGSHIIIDDVIHDTFHLTGLFGLAGGCAVVCAQTEKTLKECFKQHYNKDIENSPFVYATPVNFEKKINELLDNPERLQNIGINARKWIVKNYHPKDLILNYKNIYDRG